jgi:hypothetical protein
MRTFLKRLFPGAIFLRSRLAAFQVVGHLMRTGFGGPVAANGKMSARHADNPGALKG